MREVYKKLDFKNALETSLTDNTFLCILAKNLIQSKLDRLISEHKEEMRLYTERYEPLVIKNEGKDPKEYNISSLMVNKINKSIKKILSLTNSIEFYSKQMESIYDRASEDKRKKIIYALIEKIE